MSIDTINDLPPRVQYIASASQTVFPYPFPIFQDADLVVEANGAIQTLTTQYTVSGEGDDLGGDVTFVTGRTAGDIITIYRATIIERDSDFQQNGPLFSASVNDELDKLIIIAQELRASIKRCLRIPNSAEVDDADIELTPISSWFNKYMSFDSTGKPTPAELVTGTITGPIIGALLFPRTQAEIDAGVTPTNYAYKAYDLPRYGAAIDGATNDGTAVRNWLLAAIEAGVPATSSIAGTALCTSFTTINTTDVIRIDAPGLTIRGPSSRVDFLRPGGNFFLRNVGLDRWLSAIEREIGDTGSITAAVVQNCTISDCDSIGIHIQRPCDNIRIVDNNISDCVDYGIRIGMDEGSIQETWQLRFISGNKISDIHGNGSLDVGGILVYGHKCLIVKNEITDIENTGTQGAWGIYTKCRYLTVGENIINTVATASNGDCVGISIKGAGRGGAPVGVEGYSVVVASNQVYSIGTANNRGVGMRLQPDDILCYGNLIEEAGLNGIVCDQPNTSNICVQNNQIRFNGSPSARTGLYCTWDGSRHRALHNTIINAAVGMQLDAGSDLLIEGNEFNTTTSAIQTNSGGTMNGVVIRGNRQNGAGAGWVNSGGTLTNWVFEDNGNWTYSNAIPKGTTIRQKAKVQTTNATVTNLFIIELADNASYSIRMFVSGTKSDGSDRAMYGRDACIYRDGAGATLQGSVQAISGVESNASWDASISAASNSAAVVVQGVAATTVDWQGSIEIIST